MVPITLHPHLRKTAEILRIYNANCGRNVHGLGYVADTPELQSLMDSRQQSWLLHFE